jgi:hypothetical protein
MLQFKDEAALVEWLRENLVLEVDTRVDTYKYEPGGFVVAEAVLRLGEETVIAAEGGSYFVQVL